MFHAGFGIKGPAQFVVLDKPSAEELQKLASHSTCIIAPTGIAPEVKARRISVQGLELQW
jgi:hypothetical protein